MKTATRAAVMIIIWGGYIVEMKYSRQWQWRARALIGRGAGPQSTGNIGFSERSTIIPATILGRIGYNGRLFSLFYKITFTKYDIEYCRVKIVV